MKINFYYLILFLITALATGCQKEKIQPKSINFQQLPTNPIRYDAPEVGQKCRYLIATGTLTGNNRPELSLTGDTLIVSVTGETKEGFLVEESLSQELANEKYYDLSCYPLQSIYQFQGDTLTVLPVDEECPNSIFMGRLPAKVYLGKIEENPIKIEDLFRGATGWPTRGYIENYDHYGYRFDHLNISGLDQRPWDGNYYAILYSDRTGVVKSYTFGPWQRNLLQLDLLSE